MREDETKLLRHPEVPVHPSRPGWAGEGAGITSPPPRGRVRTASPVSARGLPLAEMV